MAQFTRRQATLSLAGAALAPALRPARAEEQGQVILGTWGGGTSAVYRKALKVFTDRTGIPARVAEWPDPEPAIRAQASNPQYNAGVAPFMDAYKLHRDGLLETFSDADLPGIEKLPPEHAVRSKDGRIYGAPVNFSCYGIAYNRDLAKSSDFDSWKSLGDPKWKGKLAMTRVIWASTLDLTLFAKINGGNEKNIEPGIPLLKALAANAAVVYTGMAQMNALLTRGEVVATPYYSSRFWGSASVANAEFQIPREGGLLQPYMVVVPKGSPHVAAARRLLAFALEAKTQELLAAESGYMPFNPEAQLTPEMEKKVGMPLATLRTKLYQPDWGIVAEKQQERIDLVEQLLSQTR